MKNDNMKNQYRVNEQIRVREVRIVGDDGSTVVPTRQALDMARAEGVDLVEISPNANPPVCRIIDYSKFLYQQKKHAKEMKAKVMPTMQTPSQLARVHTYPAQKVPSEPPMK